MRSKSLCVAAGCMLFSVLPLLPIFSSGTPRSATEKVLYSFAGGKDGQSPSSDLTLDSEGNLYGTTFFGGEENCVYRGETWPGCGTVFELRRTVDGWKEQILYRFNASGNNVGGALPAAGLIFDNAGNLYGTTEGQPNDCDQGNVFKLSPATSGEWTETVLYSFTCGNGYNPTIDLVFDNKGDLFGVASDIVFELIPQANGSWAEVTLHKFNGAPDGLYPDAAVVLDSSGNVYGTTTWGGTGKCYLGCGIVYKLSPAQNGDWTETVLYNFTRGRGFAENPSSGLILHDPDHLFLTTVAGGDGLGALVELTQAQKGWEQRVLYRFYGNPDGYDPIGKVEINAGVGFGATSRGGTSGLGTIFGLERSPANKWRETVLHSFAGGSDGSYPAAGMVSDSHGHLFGTTSAGGTGCKGNGCGTVYEITP